MEKEFIYVAGTVDEAIKNGLADLGLKEEDVKIEVLEGGSAGIFGLFKKEARVKLSPLDSEFKKEDKPKVEEKEVKEVKVEEIVEEKQKKTTWAEKLEKMRQQYPNAYRPWKLTDDVKLQEAIFENGKIDNKLISKLSKELGRHKGSIKARIKKLFGESAI